MCALVTGVQTCALPISAIAVPIDAHAIRIDEATPDEFIDATHHVIDHDIPPARALAGCAVVLVARTVGSDMRSEESRVGKECVRTGRSRWSPNYDKKTNRKNRQDK